jgi:hypothetical protein
MPQGTAGGSSNASPSGGTVTNTNKKKVDSKFAKTRDLLNKRRDIS